MDAEPTNFPIDRFVTLIGHLEQASNSLAVMLSVIEDVPPEERAAFNRNRNQNPLYKEQLLNYWCLRSDVDKDLQGSGNWLFPWLREITQHPFNWSEEVERALQLGIVHAPHEEEICNAIQSLREAIRELGKLRHTYGAHDASEVVKGKPNTTQVTELVNGKFLIEIANTPEESIAPALADFIGEENRPDAVSRGDSAHGKEDALNPDPTMIGSDEANLSQYSTLSDAVEAAIKHLSCNRVDYCSALRFLADGQGHSLSDLFQRFYPGEGKYRQASHQNRTEQALKRLKKELKEETASAIGIILELREKENQWVLSAKFVPASETVKEGI